MNKTKVFKDHFNLKRRIIISGPQGSGKNKIADAIALQYTSDRVLKISSKDLLKGIDHPLWGKLDLYFDLVIIDECSIEDIENIFSKPSEYQFIVSSINLTGTHFSKFGIVFLTQDDVKFDSDSWHIIKLR